MDFGDLKDDKKIQEKIATFQNSIDQIDQMLELGLNCESYDKLSVKEKVDYDLFITYALNTLFWLYLRSRGVDPNQTDVKNQLNRIKEYMKKAKEAHERNTIRPRVNQEAAKRFVKHGVGKQNDQNTEPPHKKSKKFQ